jgi:hypothetical protein
MDDSCRADGLCGVDRLENAAKSLPVSRASSFLGANPFEFSLGVDLLCPAPAADFPGRCFGPACRFAAAHLYLSKNVDHCSLVDGALFSLDRLPGISESGALAIEPIKTKRRMESYPGAAFAIAAVTFYRQPVPLLRERLRAAASSAAGAIQDAAEACGASSDRASPHCRRRSLPQLRPA